jgi:hypothetical protein
MVMIAWFDTKLVKSLTVYGIGVGSSVKPDSGVNVTLPLPSTLHSPWPATTSVVCWPASDGFRSTDVGSKSPFGSLSLVRMFSVTGPGGLASELSFTAIGGNCW